MCGHPFPTGHPGLCAHSWVLYEEPEFQGRKLVLPEGDVELRAPGPAWSPQGIGSLRRVVRVSGWVEGTRCCPVYPKPRALRKKTDLEFLGEMIWDQSLTRIYCGLTCRCSTSKPTGEERDSRVFRGRAEAKPHPRAPASAGEGFSLSDRNGWGWLRVLTPHPGPRLSGPQPDPRCHGCMLICLLTDARQYLLCARLHARQ